MLDDVPTSHIESARETIWAWRFVQLLGAAHAPHLVLGERSLQLGQVVRPDTQEVQVERDLRSGADPRRSS
jgi:hypothetical protein